MLTSVSQLSGSSLRQSVVSEHIHEILSLVAKTINRENKLGNNEIIYDLPIVFRNIHTSHEVASTIIYTTVMKELEQKGYNIKISRRDRDHPRLVIKWASGVTNVEILIMEKYLQEHSI